MEITTAILILSLSFSTASAAFGVTDKDIREGRISKACGEALETDIECHDYIPGMNLNYYGKWVGDVALADRICTDTCSESFRSWNDTATKDCAKDTDGPDSYGRVTPFLLISMVGQMWQAYNETCVKNVESGRYCQGY